MICAFVALFCLFWYWWY